MKISAKSEGNQDFDMDIDLKVTYKTFNVVITPLADLGSYTYINDTIKHGLSFYA